MIALRRATASFLRDRRGVSAIEFCILAPVILVLYCGMSELSSALMTAQRNSHSASALGDLAGQYQTLQLTDVQNIFNASTQIMQPFTSTPLKLRLTSVTLQTGNKAMVDWDVSGTAQAVTKGSSNVAFTGTLPTGLLVNTGDSIIVSEADYTYTSPVSYNLLPIAPFKNIFYLRPRYGTTIACTTCT